MFVQGETLIFSLLIPPMSLEFLQRGTNTEARSFCLPDVLPWEADNALYNLYVCYWISLICGNISRTGVDGRWNQTRHTKQFAMNIGFFFLNDSITA